MTALKTQIMDEWAALNCCYTLTIEPEIYWRLGEPAPRQKQGRWRGGE